MEYSKFRISLDLYSRISQATLPCKRGDTAYQIVATLTENGKTYPMTEGCYALFTAKKPDGNYICNDCTIEGNTICYKLTPQTTAVVGITDCEIMVYDKDDDQIASPRFSLEVEDTLYNDESIISSPEMQSLREIESEFTDLIDEVEQKLENGEFSLKFEDLTEEQKAELAPDLTDYVKKTDYATSSSGGVIKPITVYATEVNKNGNLLAATKTYEQYASMPDSAFIGKRTLENVIAGKGLGNLALVVNAIDTVETQMVSKSASTYLYQNWGEYYNWDDTVGDVVRDNRSNYTINGEPAQVITVPGCTVYDYEGNPQEYSSFLGLESATWKSGYQEQSTYAMKVLICKDSNIYNNNYQYEMTVSYDEEEATVTTTIDTPLVDILNAIGNGTDVICKWNKLILRLAEYDLGWSAVFTAMGKAYNGSYDYFYRITYDYAKVTAEKRRVISYLVT